MFTWNTPYVVCITLLRWSPNLLGLGAAEEYCCWKSSTLSSSNSSVLLTGATGPALFCLPSLDIWCLWHISVPHTPRLFSLKVFYVRGCSVITWLEWLRFITLVIFDIRLVSLYTVVVIFKRQHFHTNPISSVKIRRSFCLQFHVLFLVLSVIIRFRDRIKTVVLDLLIPVSMSNNTDYLIRMNSCRQP